MACGKGLSPATGSDIMAQLPLIEDLQLWLLFLAVFTAGIIAFWPLMPVFIWGVAIAAALLPAHKRLRRIAGPAASATFITVWVLLLILLVMSLVVTLLMINEEHIGDIGLSIVTGLKNTVLSGFLPSFTAGQLDNFDETLKAMSVQMLLSLTGNILQTLLSIIIFFLTLSMLLFHGEAIWDSIERACSPRLSRAVARMSEITESTIYALLVVQISAAIIAFALAIPFFWFLGYGDILLFSTMIGFAMLVPLIGAQAMILLLTLYFFSLGDTRTATIMLVVGYPLLSGWIDFYYRPVMMGRRVAVHPVIMMIGIFAGVPFMGIVGFIVGPVLVALIVTGAGILADEYCGPASPAP
jgi:predicted PurR-regulated permease PerM